MSAADALRMAHAAGVELSVDQDHLVLEAPSEPPSAVLDMLRQHKPGVVELLRRGLRVRYCSWSAEDWQLFFDERAGIAEFDGGLSRVEAEARAFACCVAEWLNRNPARSPPGRCFGCGGYEFSHDRLLPVGIGSAGEVWLHSGCSSAWYAGRKAEAVIALAAMGISAPANFPNDFGKTGANNGRLRIGTTERLGARYGRVLPFDRR
jgi:hypothetical protein